MKGLSPTNKPIFSSRRGWAFCLLLWCMAMPICAQNDPTQVMLADPYILVEDGTYYAYGTHSADGIECYTSHDLRNWTFRGLALHKDNTTESRWFWAPEVYHFGKKYYMYYSGNEHLYVAVADSPLGPFRQHGGRMMANTLGDQFCIDSSICFDDEGSPWMFFVRNDDGNCIWQVKLESDYMTPIPSTLQKCIAVSAEWEDIWPRVNEGPNVVKHRGMYYLTYSANSYESPDYAVGYATSRSITGPWVKYEGNPILRRAGGLVGTGHHSLFKDRKGRLRIVFHSHFSTQQIHNRRMFIGSAKFRGKRLQINDKSFIRPALVE